ncbi:sporulation kinase [Pullulanibacillus camelliae]|uniref:histidine kinase n=1 Tax=Pullulanibacillus camelliae TaxID=1707096 RepID=A0A8J2YFK6_9BACL|nr:sensor histidine kinase [Pullulanibacillus camelliae]GGE29376.1 sporulation kinase [Pullulanibacillus camelliae]
MLQFKDLIVNFFVVLLPLYMFLLFGKRTIQSFRHTLFYGIVGSLAILLCMIFPVSAVEGLTFDLREVPVIMSFLFMNSIIGILLSGVCMAIRLALGGEGFFWSFFIQVVLMVILLFFRRRFNQFSPKQKYLCLTFISLVTTLLIDLGLLLFYKNERMFSVASGVIFLTQCIALFVIMYTMERFNRNILTDLKLQKAEKAQIVSDLAASVSHEVRNPLTVTKGFIQLVLKDGLPEKTKYYLSLAHEEIVQAEQVISDYLTFAKPVLEDPKRINLKEELEKTLRLLIPYANMKSIIIQFDRGEHTDIGVIGEAHKLHQCFSNVIKNCIEASPSGSVIEISLYEEKGMAVVSIVDHGIGMTDEEIARLGEPYFSTKKKGTGLGMMVVFSIIQSMNGRIHIKSKKDQGTQFVIELPRAR